LDDQDVVDLMLFLSTRAGTRPVEAAFTIGEPELGRAVFDASCRSCHTLGVRERSKVDLLERRGPESITGYIAEMWNHAPTMRRRGGATPKLQEGDMPNLISFLFSQRYFFEPGNADRGRRVFEEKNCVTCHQTRRKESGAPDLFGSIEAYSPMTLSAAVWRHGSGMMQQMKQQRLDWPQFERSEMADLIAYMNSRLVPRVAQ
jgi:mono/diheme cytochrome c family protein